MVSSSEEPRRAAKKKEKVQQGRWVLVFNGFSTLDGGESNLVKPHTEFWCGNFRFFTLYHNYQSFSQWIALAQQKLPSQLLVLVSPQDLLLYFFCAWCQHYRSWKTFSRTCFRVTSGLATHEGQLLDSARWKKRRRRSRRIENQPTATCLTATEEKDV